MTPQGSVLLEPPAPVRPSSGGGAHGGRRGHDDHGRGDGGSNGPDGAGSLPLSNERLLMVLVLVGSTMLFTGMIGAFIVLRISSDPWPLPGSPPLPLGLTINTGVILASSAALAVAHVAQRRGRAGALKAGLLLACALAVVFLLLQAQCWRHFLLTGFTAARNTYGASFWLLTTTHFAHAVAGLLLLALATAKALRGTMIEQLRLPLDLAAMFWHFVDAAWLVIFFALRA